MLKATNNRPMRGSVAEREFALVFLCVSVLGMCGCFTAKRPTFHVADVAAARPVIPVLLPNADGALITLPDITLEAASMPPRLAPAHPGPLRPHVPPQPNSEPAPVERAPEPVIVPELSSEELAGAKTQTFQSLNVAERNLALIQGKQLNSAQSDLASKIRGFMETARDAARNSDWLRARNLAKKAEVLSQELAGNL